MAPAAVLGIEDPGRPGGAAGREVARRRLRHHGPGAIVAGVGDVGDPVAVEVEGPLRKVPGQFRQGDLGVRL